MAAKIKIISNPSQICPVSDSASLSKSSAKTSGSNKTDKMSKTLEKFEIDCDIDKQKDCEFWGGISENEKKFYLTKCRDIYEFLKEVSLVRYIGLFINDGFERREDLMEIEEDYFVENRCFNRTQQRKILEKVKEYKVKYSSELIESKTRNTQETGVGSDSDLTLKRCWTCYNKLNDSDYIEKAYSDSIITKKERFCSRKCMSKFEENIYAYCDHCNMIYDKSKGDFIYENRHFHSEKCRDLYLKKCIKTNISVINNGNVSEVSEGEDGKERGGKESFKYDPMDDF